MKKHALSWDTGRAIRRRVVLQSSPQSTSFAASYYRARYYDPNAGRFVSEDPLKSQIKRNRYRYVSNNPLIFNDPLGLIETCSFSGAEPLISWQTLDTVGMSDWILRKATETGGPEGFVPTAILNCAWDRKVSKTLWSNTLRQLTWDCTDTSPCGATKHRIKYAFERRRRFLRSWTDTESRVTSFSFLATDSEEVDMLYCLDKGKP